MNIAIFGRGFSENFLPPVQQLFNKLHGINAVLLIYKPFYEYLNSKITIHGNFTLFEKHEEIKGKAEFFFSIGGDGTILDALTLVRDSGIPVMGINTGRLGYLSTVSAHEIDHAIEVILKKKYVIAKRTLLSLETKSGLFGEVNYALNEMTIHKKDSSSMIVIHTYLNDTFLNTYWADGLIVATPTGSTAYSISCGGPVILPGCSNFVITPISPHNLNVRPIVYPDTFKVTLKVEGRSDSFLATLDSRIQTIDSSTELTVNKCPFPLNLLRLDQHGYIETLRNKLNLGLDKRNY